MSGFIEGENRHQATLFPERLDDYIAEDSAVRVIDVFIDDLDISGLGFKSEPADTGRPGYHPRTMLKIYVYGYMNRVQSSRRLEREAQRNVELMWLTGRLAPDFKTIADFRKDNGEAIRLVCREFVMLCRKLDLLADAFVAIDGSKFKAVNNRDRNFTKAKMKRRLQQIDQSIERYLGQIASADRQESQTAKAKTQRLEDKIAGLKKEMARLKKLEARMRAAPDQQISLTDPDARSMATSGRGTGMVGYNVQTALVKVPSKDTKTVINALIKQAHKLPRELYKSLTWDRGTEMADHKRFSLDTDIKVYFCDPRSPWQRGSNENTNGLLRQYFPKGMDLSNTHQNRLNAVARQLNERPRKTLDYRTPAERFSQCVASTG